MKCPRCNGEGTVLKIIYEDWQKDEIVRSAVKCPRCNGSGEVDMTNEEWLKQCTTEQLAEFLAGIINTNPCGYLLSCNECRLNDRCREDDYPTSAEAWVEWLKQPHTKE